jgi:cell wall-associated NlpC family hydrolase
MLRHTVAMRRGVWLLVLGVVAAALGVAPARAAGSATTTTAATPTTTTTSATPTPSYASLPASSLPTGCLGAGAGALVLPGRPVIALGSPASGLGPSAYKSSSGTVFGFGSSAASGSACKSAAVTLSSVSLFDGAVTASSVHATNGKGTVTGLEIDGAAVTATAGLTVPVGDWGQLTLGATIGRVTAPLVLSLLRTHDSLTAGTTLMVAFAASAPQVDKPIPKHWQAHTPQERVAGASHAREHSAGTHHSRKNHRRREALKRGPAFPESDYPFLTGGGLAPGAPHNGAVSIAMHFLGVPYLWGGASPKTGFDCSGLVKYVFAKLGVSLPHFAASQWHAPDSVWVSPHRLKPGDLVFFVGSDGTRKAPGHVGIYVSDGYIIDAPHTGSFVRIDRLSEPGLADGYVGARRIVSASLHGRRPLRIARHLLHVTKPGPSASASPLGFPPLTAFGPTGESSRILAAGVDAIRPAARTPTAQQWTGIGLGGVLLLLVPGAFTYRRRRRTPDAVPSIDS